MYAVIRTGGKQYRVAQGDRLKIEKLAGDVGGKVKFDVLLVGGEGDARVGAPVVAGAAVEGEIVAQGKNKKVVQPSARRRNPPCERPASEQLAEITPEVFVHSVRERPFAPGLE